MKEHIYTINITDALEENSECLLCSIEEKMEAAAVEYFVGAAMMEPDIRCVTNEKGFCLVHYKKMHECGKLLPLALVLQTRLKEIYNDIEPEEKKKKSLFSKSENGGIEEKIKKDFSDCAICSKVAGQMENCISNFVYLLSDKEFKEKFFASKGLCMKHFEKALHYTKGDLKNELILHQKKEIERIINDIDRFVLKFDYRNADMPWENAKDAPERAMKKLRGDYGGKF